jgi:opacity protein-like surface antigen
MTKIRDTLLVGAALILGTATAGAADLNGSLKDRYAPGLASTPTISPTWYLRVDGGFAQYDRPTMVLDGVLDLTDTSIDRQWMVGGGVGAYVGHGGRVDFTVERRFSTKVGGDFLFDLGGPNQSSVRTSNDLQSTLLLANFYYDFNRGSRFTPYIGVGIGAVHHNVEAGTFSSTCGCVQGTIDSYKNWHVAGAVMAGVDIKLRDRLHFDAGYRFLYLGETSTGAARPTFVANGGQADIPINRDPTIEQIHAHEFRFGLRYDIQ